MSQLERAVEIAESAHRGQIETTGKPYVEHCHRVAQAVEGRDEKIVAYLHDTLEKGHGWSPERLLEAGFSRAVVSAVDALTRRPGEADRAFVRRAASNKLARPVKLADLEDNLRQAREAGVSAERYEEAISILQAEFDAK
jgi:(p)ppGpp synthase/HD superfamily hydrolase